MSNEIIINDNIKKPLYSKEETNHFVGGWSYTPTEMYELFKYIPLRDSFSILEFGGGDSSKKIYDLINKYCANIEYDIYENNLSFQVNYKNINTINYSIDNIENIVIPDKKYDLILIDGPNGEKRSFWYSKIRHCIKDNTILLIDDYNHFEIFEQELNRNFTYNILSLCDIPFVAYGEHSWRIVNNIKLKDL